MTARDPRRDPAAGDLLRKGNVWRRVERLEIVQGPFGVRRVRVMEWPEWKGGSVGYDAHIKRPSLGQFRKWAQGAEVVR